MTTQRELDLQHPWMNAAGILGFSPDLKSPVEISQLGAFVTHPVSFQPRTPARGTRFISFPGGFLLHTGYPNPGLSAVLKRHIRRWSRSPIPVIIHLLASETTMLGEMVEHLEGVDNVIGVEIGLHPNAHPDLACEMIRAAQGELPVIARVPFGCTPELATALAGAGACALSLAPPRGLLPDTGGELVSGRLYGPAFFAQALVAVQALVTTGVPIIGAGGVYTAENADAMLSVGAVAVQIDAALWREGAPLLASTRSGNR